MKRSGRTLGTDYLGSASFALSVCVLFVPRAVGEALG